MNINDIEKAKGTYAELQPSDASKQKLETLLTFLHLEKPLPVDKIHVTVIYSRKACPAIKDVDANLPIDANGKSFGILDTALVVHLDSPGMVALHNFCRREHGATHDFKDFLPHITLTYHYNSDVLPDQSLLSYLQGLEFDKYIVEPLDLDWKGSM